MRHVSVTTAHLMAAGVQATGTPPPLSVGPQVLTAVVTFWDIATCRQFRLNMYHCLIHYVIRRTYGWLTTK
jgi:hypothetical protein